VNSWVTQSNLKSKNPKMLVNPTQNQTQTCIKNDFTNSKSNSNMQKKRFNQLKIKLKYAKYAFFNKFEFLILSWLNQFFCILKLVDSLFLHI
jgi:hypothetical protein